MNSLNMKIKFSIFLFLSSCYITNAQTGGGKTGNLGNEDVNVVKEYTPVLNDAFKININPDNDTSTFKSAQSLTYKVEARPINSNYNTSPIKPVKIKDDIIKKLYHGWIKAGYGLENMPLLDASFNSLRSKNFDAGIHVEHLSASGKINDFGYPGNATSKIGAFGTRYFDKFKLGAALGFRRDMVHYYGFMSPPDLYEKSETKHSMNDINGRVFLSTLETDADKWKFNSALDFYTFSDNFKSDENNVKFEAGGSKLLNNAVFSVQASGEFGKIQQASYNFNRSIIRVNPRFTITKDLFSIAVGANVAIESNNGKSNYRLYPHLRAEYQVINDAFKVFAELSGDLERNDLRSLSRENPFFGPFVPLVNTNNKLSISGGTSIKLEHDLMFTGQATFKRLRNMPFFYNFYDSLFPVTFTAVYDNINLLNIKGSLEYKQTEKASAAISAEFNKYNMNKIKDPYYAPAFRFGLSGHYAIAEKIYVKADFFYNSDITGISYTKKDSVVTSSTINIKGWFDANIGIDYRYSKVLSAWVSLNNIGFSRYFRWYQYPSYRFLGMAGVTYSF